MSIFIVAEIGINHNGDMSICKELIDVAVESDCNAVKFQKRDLNKVYTQDFLSSPRTSPWGKTQHDQKAGLEFGLQEYKEIDSYCRERNIHWFASAWDLNSQKFLQQFDCKYNKVASAMIVYEDLLKIIAKEGKHTFISTGMSTFNDIQKAEDPEAYIPEVVTIIAEKKRRLEISVYLTQPKQITPHSSGKLCHTFLRSTMKNNVVSTMKNKPGGRGERRTPLAA